MIGYKTGGDWTDVTSIGRNEVVFEGRHKAYGAFYIRKRYPNALLFSLFSAICFVGLCSFTAYVLRGTISIITPKDKGGVVITPVDKIAQPKVITPLINHPRVQPPKHSVPRFAPPIVVRQPIDSAPVIKTAHDAATNPIGTSGTGPSTTIDNRVETTGASLPKELDKPLMRVTEMPRFSKGSIQNYLATQLQYPEDMAREGIEGTVYATFIIEKDGSVSSVTLLQGISGAPELNAEAIRVLSEMPNWIPGKQDGHPVRVQFSVPIHFKLR